MADVDWTDGRKARLRALCANPKLSYTDIAAQLTQEFGITVPRNGCIGKAHRMGIKRRRMPAETKRRKRPATAAPEPTPQVWPRWRVLERPLPPERGRGRATIEQLEHNMCRWPFGDRVPYLFCGDPTAGKSYCAYHTGISCGYRMRAEALA